MTVGSRPLPQERLTIDVVVVLRCAGNAKPYFVSYLASISAGGYGNLPAGLPDFGIFHRRRKID